MVIPQRSHEKATLAAGRPPQLLWLGANDLERLLGYGLGYASVDERRETLVEYLPLLTLPLGDLVAWACRVLIELGLIVPRPPTTAANTDSWMRIIRVIDLKRRDGIFGDCEAVGWSPQVSSAKRLAKVPDDSAGSHSHKRRDVSMGRMAW